MPAVMDWEVNEHTPPSPNDSKAWGRQETLFSLANGHLGMRGDLEESLPHWQRGTYVNGFFETEPIVYGELAFGFAQDHQTMLNLPDGRLIGFEVDGEAFSITEGTCVSWVRRLDLKKGVLERQLEWQLKSGRKIFLTVVRIVSLARPEVAILSFRLRLGSAGNVKILSGFDTSVRNLSAGQDPRVGSKLADDCLEFLEPFVATRADGRAATAAVKVLTRNSRLGVACAARSVLETPGAWSVSVGSASDSNLLVAFEGLVDGDHEIRLTKYLAYSQPFDRDSAENVSLDSVLDAAEAQGFEGLAEEQAKFLQDYWDLADIEVSGDPSIQQALRFNAFQLLQSAGRDGKTNLAAKGLSGEGYEGHYFWDTEVYSLPLFTYTDPAVAKSLLGYRSNTLDAARDRASELDFKGALYPWRTINGREASAYYEAGTAQYHINGDIILAARRYALVSGDEEFMAGPLARMSVETARFWLDLGDFVERTDGTTVAELESRKGQPVSSPFGSRSVFCLNTVTGTDEYTALVNNNVYTNLMAAMNLAWAADLLDWLSRKDPETSQALIRELNIGPEEVGDWNYAAERMFVPYDFERNLFPQDDAFFQKAPWFVDREPVAKRPLLLHYHPLVIYRYQVLKQPDLVLAQFLSGDLFTRDEKRRHFHYYEPLTTGDSSLSHCIQSIVAAETGDPEKAWNYLTKTVRMDLDDLHGNVHDGIHAAAMAGSWLSMVYGFAGLREHYTRKGKEWPQSLSWSFDPTLPQELESFRFRLRLRSSVLEVTLRRGHEDNSQSLRTQYRLLGGAPLSFLHRSRLIRLTTVAPEQTEEDAHA